MEQKYYKIGEFQPGTEASEEMIIKVFHSQGWIFKDEEAFELYPDKVCYIPELSDEKYTRNDFMELFNGQYELAAECFHSVDWQHPETWKDEQFSYYEMDYCPKCKKIYLMPGEQIPCPICGTNPDEAEEIE